jgi:hypothetical protein
LTIRFYFNPSSTFLASGSTYTCSSQQLYVHGRKLKAIARKELIDTFWNSRVPISLSHTSCDRMSITQTLAASTQYEFTLQGIRGIASFMTITVKLASTANTTAPITYLPSSGLDILDGNGNSLLGAVNRNRNIQKIHYASVINNDCLVQTGLNFISWSSDPRGAFSSGQANGYCVFTGDQVLRLTTGSTTTSASHILDIRAYMLESVVFQNGELKAIRD